MSCAAGHVRWRWSPSARSRAPCGDYAAAGIRVEGSGAASLAAYRNRPAEQEPVVLIVTGRNIDDELHRRCVEDPDSFPD